MRKEISECCGALGNGQGTLDMPLVYDMPGLVYDMPGFSPMLMKGS